MCTHSLTRSYAFFCKALATARSQAKSFVVIASGAADNRVKYCIYLSPSLDRIWVGVTYLQARGVGVVNKPPSLHLLPVHN